MKIKGTTALFLSLLMLSGVLTACGSVESADGNFANHESESVSVSTDDTDVATPESNPTGATGAVYYLNFKPEQEAEWKDLAETYKKQTGTEVTVVTAASGQYEVTLRSEIEKTEAPTLFQINGPVGLARWGNYCYDLSDTLILDELTSDEFALKNNNEIAGVGYVRGRKLALSLHALQASDLRVIDVAREFGFEHEQSYARAFKSEYGCSPGEARRQKKILAVRMPIVPSDYSQIEDGILCKPEIVVFPEMYIIGRSYGLANFTTEKDEQSSVEIES